MYLQLILKGFLDILPYFQSAFSLHQEISVPGNERTPAILTILSYRVQLF